MQEKRGWESESRASVKAERMEKWEMFQGGREGERQMNRQIITNVIISCYSSEKKGMRQGVHQ